MKSVFLAPSTLLLVIILQTLTAQQSHAQGFVGAATDVPVFQTAGLWMLFATYATV